MGVSVSLYMKDLWEGSRNRRYWKRCRTKRGSSSVFDPRYRDTDLWSKTICLFLGYVAKPPFDQLVKFFEKCGKVMWDAVFRMSSSLEHDCNDGPFLNSKMDETELKIEERKRAMFLVLLLIIRLLALLCNGILTNLNIKKLSRTKYCSETIAGLVLWCSGDVERNPGPTCDDLRDFCKKMISLLVIRYWESVERKQFGQADYKKKPNGWPEDAWFGDPSKCNKRDRDVMLNILLDMCFQQGVDIPDEWLTLTEKYRKALDKNCCKTEKEQCAGELRAWVKNLRSKEIVDQTFDKILDVPVLEKNVIIAQIFEKLKKHVPDLHSDMLRSQIVVKNSIATQQLEPVRQTKDTSLNLSNSSGKNQVTDNYVAPVKDTNTAVGVSSNDTTIQENTCSMSSNSFGFCSSGMKFSTNTLAFSKDTNTSANHDQWLDDIIVENLGWNSTNDPIISPSIYLQSSENSDEADNTCNKFHQSNLSKTSLGKRKCTTVTNDDDGQSAPKQMLTQGNGNLYDEADTTLHNVTLDDITQVIRTDRNVDSGIESVPTMAEATKKNSSGKLSVEYEYDKNISDAFLQFFCE